MSEVFGSAETNDWVITSQSVGISFAFVLLQLVYRIMLTQLKKICFIITRLSIQIFSCFLSMKIIVELSAKERACKVTE